MPYSSTTSLRHPQGLCFGLGGHPGADRFRHPRHGMAEECQLRDGPTRPRFARRIRHWWKRAAAAAPWCGPGRRSGGGRWRSASPLILYTQVLAHVTEAGSGALDHGEGDPRRPLCRRSFRGRAPSGLVGPVALTACARPAGAGRCEEDTVPYARRGTPLLVTLLSAGRHGEQFRARQRAASSGVSRDPGGALPAGLVVRRLPGHG
jgi:hypothetical protein